MNRTISIDARPSRSTSSPSFAAGRDSTQPLRYQRGASLLESLIAIVVLAGCTVASGHLLGQFRFGADVARQRSEASRLAGAEMERLQGGAAVIGVTTSTPGDRQGDAANAAYRIVREVTAASPFEAIGRTLDAALRVQWLDRSGAPREVRLASLLGPDDAAYAGSLTLGAGAVPAAPRGAFGRAPAIPLDALDLGDGRSAWRPEGSAASAYLFDNASGQIVARCALAATAATPAGPALAAGDLGACRATRSLWIGGAVRFAGTDPLRPGTDDVPLATNVTLALEGGLYPAAPDCASAPMKTVRRSVAGSLRIEAVPLAATPASLGTAAWQETGERYVAWHCVIAPRADGRWSGHAVLAAGAGWALGDGPAGRRVCRTDGAANEGRHLDVATALMAENFIVVGGTAACPAAPFRP